VSLRHWSAVIAGGGGGSQVRVVGVVGGVVAGGHRREVGEGGGVKTWLGLLLWLMEQRGCPNLPLSHWVGELDVDDLKFPSDARNSCNHYTTAPIDSNSCVHELASPRRLALANVTRTQATMKKQQSRYY
jgi:hypothetical protein